MTLISKRLCKPTELSWDEPVPGRLLHVRIHGTSRGIDIINGYQHVHAHDRMDDRTIFWDSLQTTMTAIPSRNNMILLGDWNTSLTARTTVTGLETYAMDTGRATGPHHDDSFISQHSSTT